MLIFFFFFRMMKRILIELNGSEPKRRAIVEANETNAETLLSQVFLSYFFILNLRTALRSVSVFQRELEID